MTFREVYNLIIPSEDEPDELYYGDQSLLDTIEFCGGLEAFTDTVDRVIAEQDEQNRIEEEEILQIALESARKQQAIIDAERAKKKSIGDGNSS